jgi:Bacterial type II and III secretion system protein
VGAAVAPTNSPSFIKREAETSVVLLNNQTLVLGGLIQDKTTKDDRGTPWFKNIPILGYLFGFKDTKIEKTELLMMITPRVVGTALDAARITEEMRRATPELNDAIRSAPRAPPTVRPPAIPSPVPVPPGTAPGGVPPIPPPPEPGAPPPGPSGRGPAPGPPPAAAVPPASPPAPLPTESPPRAGSPFSERIRGMPLGGEPTPAPDAPGTAPAPPPRN